MKDGMMNIMQGGSKGFLCCIVVIVGGFFLEVESQIGGNPVVSTQYGQIIGNRKLYNGKFYEEFLGIPFAAPPVDELRWQKPQPVEPWEPDVWNGTEYSIHCTQLIATLYTFIGMGGRSGEDCLYLNVYVPKGVSANDGRKLPVMFWIYGGAFLLGTGEMYPGHALALHGDVIVVNFNYRVSTLGWLSTGDSAIPGNYGLWDLQYALQWVQDNIHSFNGNPDQVTIFGQSAGGSITSHAVISPQTNKLFKSAIAVSGSASGYFGLAYEPLRVAMQLSGIFNCSAQNTKDIEVCLRDVGPHTLDFWGLVGNLRNEGRLPSLLPVVDGDFVPRMPKESFELGEGKDINLITGSAFQDAAGFVLLNPIAMPRLNRTNLAATNESLIRSLEIALGFAENTKELIEMIFGMYPEINTPDNMQRTLTATKASTEWWFGSASNWETVTRLRAQGSGRSYQYQFKHRQSFLVGYPDWVNGSHVDDVYSIFGPPFMALYRRLYLRENFDDIDTAISDKIMDYYSNFAHTGNPNEGPYPDVQPEWTQFSTQDYNYLQESPEFSIESFYDDNVVDRYRFWVDFPNHYVLPPPPTFPGNYKLTEDEIELAVNNLRDFLLADIEDEEMRIALENRIEEFVEDRKQGFPINS